MQYTKLTFVESCQAVRAQSQLPIGGNFGLVGRGAQRSRHAKKAAAAPPHSYIYSYRNASTGFSRAAL